MISSTQYDHDYAPPTPVTDRSIDRRIFPEETPAQTKLAWVDFLPTTEYLLGHSNSISMSLISKFEI